MKQIASNPSLAQLAILIAYERKRRRLSQKGRKFTDRVLCQWVASRLLEELGTIVDQAAKAVASSDPHPRPTMLNTQVRDYLMLLLLRELFPRRGRRTKRGLIYVSMETNRQKRRRGRPRTLSRGNERLWLADILGVKAGLFAQRWELSYEDVIAELRTEGWQLIAEVSDANALTAAGELPTEAAKARLRRARKAHRITIPKSGG